MPILANPSSTKTHSQHRHAEMQTYRSCRWRSIWTHCMRDRALHSWCYGNPLSRNWNTSIHRPWITACIRTHNTVISAHNQMNLTSKYETFSNYEASSGQVPLASIGGPRGSIMGGALGSTIMFRGSPMGGPLMSIGGLISGGGAPPICGMCTGGTWWGGGGPM